MVEVSNTDNVIDSRDVIARIKELEDERTGLVEDVDGAKSDESDALHEYEEERDSDDPDITNLDQLAGKLDDAQEAVSDARKSLEEWDDDNGAELKALKDFADEASGYADDWQYGATLVNDEYWVEYVKELLADIGDLPRDLPSYIEIDWNATAENIKADYTSVEFDGTTFWVR